MDNPRYSNNAAQRDVGCVTVTGEALLISIKPETVNGPYSRQQQPMLLCRKHFCSVRLIIGHGTVTCSLTALLNSRPRVTAGINNNVGRPAEYYCTF